MEDFRLCSTPGCNNTVEADEVLINGSSQQCTKCKQDFALRITRELDNNPGLGQRLRKAARRGIQYH